MMRNVGYVTGDNEFFHFDPHKAEHWGIPKQVLIPAVRRGRSLLGLRFTVEDWHRAVQSKQAGYLLHIDTQSDLPKSVRAYLRHGESQGVSQAYKCRTRFPWYRVPHVYHPDAFLSYMSGSTSRLVANTAGVVAPNSLHILRLHVDPKLSSDTLAALWQTSLARLSVEIEGHALGGGMLKLEPTEAENVIVPVTPMRNGFPMRELAEELDLLVRAGRGGMAQARADAMILQAGMGLSRSDCKLLETAAELLRRRRYSRSATG
jgi:hypothetical protein